MDYLFLFRVLQEKVREIYDTFVEKTICTFDEFQAMYEEITSQPYRCMVIHLCARTSEVRNNVFQFEVPPMNTDLLGAMEDLGTAKSLPSIVL